MAYVIAVANQKGGCGKTTTVMNLAGGLTRAKYRVGVVDADPQASATIWSLAQGQGKLPFDVIPSRQLRGNVNRLGTVLGDYDIVLYDLPPGVADKGEASTYARQVIRAADALIVPIRPSTLDFSAAGTFVRYLTTVEIPPRILVLLNGYQRTSLSKQAPEEARRLFAPLPGAVVLESTIGLRAPVTEVSGSGTTIFEYRPGSKAAQEYTALTKEILQWLHNAPSSQPSKSPTISPAPMSPSQAETSPSNP